jgi:hypothetical protein
MRITEGKDIVRLEGPAGTRTNLEGRLEGLVVRLVRRPPEWEEAMRVLKATLGRENVSDRTAGDRLKALGLRYMGKTGETQGTRTGDAAAGLYLWGRYGGRSMRHNLRRVRGGTAGGESWGYTA